MKLQSQSTVRFEAKELRRLARSSRPPRKHAILYWIVAGLIVGVSCVPLIHVLKKFL
jgi:hypothetical protein